ncbi:MAG: hypothetical protein COA78_26010 [Blastopirellula sp.]|nr:MAG: hypothetical protein COA78_26010 [Blastopirellula sp.]
MNSHKRSAFTLVELLVVIGIIGVLAGLILPAIGMARESARRAHCMNNQRQIGVAVANYVSSKKDGRMPPSVSFGPPEVPEYYYSDISTGISSDVPYLVSWVVPLLVQLDAGDLDAIYRQDIYEGRYDGVARLNPQQVLRGIDLPIVRCPSNPPTKKAAAPLCYFVNAGVRNTHWHANTKSTKVFDIAANGAWSDESNLSNQRSMKVVSFPDGKSNTIMLSERIKSAGRHYGQPNWYGGSFDGVDHSTPIPYNERTLLWYDFADPDSVSVINQPNERYDGTTLTLQSAVISSNHGDVSLIMYCDGAVVAAREGMHARIFARLMTSNGRQARIDTDKDNNYKDEAVIPWQLELIKAGDL